MTARPQSFADLPLYADDLAIGAVVLGPSRAGEWKQLAPLLEPKGLPKIEELHGGRYVPDVARFYGVQRPDAIVEFDAPKTTPANRGVERPEALWKRNGQKRRA